MIQLVRRALLTLVLSQTCPDAGLAQSPQITPASAPCAGSLLLARAENADSASDGQRAKLLYQRAIESLSECIDLGGPLTLIRDRGEAHMGLLWIFLAIDDREGAVTRYTQAAGDALVLCTSDDRRFHAQAYATASELRLIGERYLLNMGSDFDVFNACKPGVRAN